jgi:hypothetical protein
VGALVAVVLVGACRPDRVPVGPPVRDPTLASIPVRGHLVQVERIDGRPPVRGELIAAGPEGLWVWTGREAIGGATAAPSRLARRDREAPEEHVHVPAAEIRRVVVHRHRSGAAVGITGGWTGGLVLLTLSHGLFFVITMPLTAAVGAGAMVATHVQSRSYVHRGRGERHAALPERLSALRGFARFPQGVPPRWPAGDAEAEAPVLPIETVTPPPAREPEAPAFTDPHAEPPAPSEPREDEPEPTVVPEPPARP